MSLARVICFAYNGVILWRCRMAQKKWQTSKIRYCEHAGREITLDTQVVFPPEHLPDQPPRILAHRCSNGLECNLIEKMVCAYCGTNPDYKPV